MSFPPVIVYTGRSLTRDEEQRLRRFSKSIIIKDARSPERLLDEVTLFLHQVEATLPPERQRMLQRGARPRERRSKAAASWSSKTTCATSSRCRACSSRRARTVEIARNGREALDALARQRAARRRARSISC